MRWQRLFVKNPSCLIDWNGNEGSYKGPIVWLSQKETRIPLWGSNVFDHLKGRKGFLVRGSNVFNCLKGRKGSLYEDPTCLIASKGDKDPSIRMQRVLSPQKVTKSIYQSSSCLIASRGANDHSHIFSPLWEKVSPFFWAAFGDLTLWPMLWVLSPKVWTLFRFRLATQNFLVTSWSS